MPLPLFHHDGRDFVMGRFGSRYQVRIHNPLPRRVEAVLSVDGRDAISGRRGDYATQRGYVLPPYGSIVVTGFRRSLQDVATFRFTTPEDSYSARMGTIENVGVVGVAFFPEAWREAPARPYREPERWRRSPAPYPESSRDRAAPAPRSPTARGGAGRRGESAAEGRLGTQYGESRTSPVTEVPFARQNRTHPDAVVTLRYDDRHGLLARGIDVDGDLPYHRYPYRAPEPFPDSRFAPPPPR